MTTQLIFEELLALAPDAAGVAYRAFAAAPDVELKAFVTGGTRVPGVSFRVPVSSVPHGLHFPKVRGASITSRPMQGTDAGHATFELVASDPAFTAVFVELAARLIDEIRIYDSARGALVALASRLAAWARFFDARDRDGLGRSGQLGLIGELLCLERLCRIAEPILVVRSWTGPKGAMFDFQSTAGAIEVKLSTSSAPERFRITSERQLDETAVGTLLLCAITVHEGPAGAAGLVDVVGRVRMMLSASAPGTLPDFEDLLLQAGYLDSDSSHYLVRVTVRSCDFAAVREGFPRITPSELRKGVFAVSYDISRDSIAPFFVLESLAGDLIRASE